MYEERFELPPFPNGWYKVCYSDELGVGEARPARIAGTDLAVYRGEDGVARVRSAYCPHLGAHLAVRGKVQGTSLVCPFHAWKFGEDGACIDVPYARHVPHRAGIKVWPAAEQSGFVMTYWHARREAPAWTPPPVPETANPDYYLHGRRKWTLTAHLQDLYENGFDVAHFGTLHRMKVKGVVYAIEGPCMNLHLEFVRDSAAQSSAEGMATIRSFMYGPGHSLTRVSGLIEGVSVQSLTPLDPGVMELTHNYYVHKGSDRAVAESFFAYYAQDWELDMPLWNHKRFYARPVLAEGDGDIARFRKWYRQFYSVDVPVDFEQSRPAA